MEYVLTLSKIKGDSMKDMVENVWNGLESFSSNNFTTFKLFENIHNDIGVANVTIKDLKQNDFKEEWKYVSQLLELLTKMIYGVYPDGPVGFDWSTNRIGSFLVKGFNFLVFDGCMDKKKSLMEKTFAVSKEEMINLLDVVYLYSIVDYRELIDNSTVQSIGMDTSFHVCFENVASSRNISMKEPKIFYDHVGETENVGILQESPCLQEKIPISCQTYCQWHKKVIENWNGRDFINTLRYGIPQRKLVMEKYHWEMNIAKELFGKENIVEIPNDIAPTSPIIFCYRKDVGYTGDDIGMHAKVCNDFFISPSDVGMVLTKNLDTKDVLKAIPNYEDLLEMNSDHRTSKGSKAKMKGGTLWSRITLVLDTNDLTHFSQTYPKQSSKGINTMQLQIHQSKEIANIIIGNSYDHLSEPITLVRGHEYHIDVFPYGQISTKAFKSLSQSQRKCNLESETGSNNIFKTYTQKNCKYSCHVRLASDKCGCKPWDFLSYSGDVPTECDAFGRSCFFRAVEVMKQSPKELCEHCLEECDYMRFRKVVTIDHGHTTTHGTGDYFDIGFDGRTIGNKAFEDLLYDHNETLIDQGLRRLYEAYIGGGVFNHSTGYVGQSYEELIIVHLQFKKPEINIISPKYSFFDMIGNFGGQFGLFEQVTGASFLGIINLVILLLKWIFSCNKHN